MLYSYIAIQNNQIKRGLCFAKDEEELKLMASFNGIKIVKKKQIKLKTRMFNAEVFTIPFLKNIQILLQNRLNIIDTLEIIKNSFQNPEHIAVVSNIIYKIKMGNNLHIAFQILEEIKVLNKTFIAMIKTAENVATLPEVIQMILQTIEQQNQNHKKLIKELTYPICLCITIFSVVIFWIFNIIPTFLQALPAEVELNYCTRILLFFRSMFINHTIFVLCFICTIIVLFVYFRKQIFIKIPFINKIIRDKNVLNLMENISLMLKANMQLPEILHEVSNICFQNELTNISLMIMSGSDIATAFSKANIFSKQENAIIAAHCKIGELDTAFSTITALLKTSLDARITKLISLIPPCLIILFGVLLLVIISSAFVPLYSYITTIALGV